MFLGDSFPFEEGQPVTEASLVADDSVQRVTDIIQNVQKIVQSPLLCYYHRRIQIHADDRTTPSDQPVQSGRAPPCHAAPRPTTDLKITLQILDCKK